MKTLRLPCWMSRTLRHFSERVVLLLFRLSWLFWSEFVIVGMNILSHWNVVVFLL